MKCQNCGVEVQNEQYQQLQDLHLEMKLKVWKQRLEDLRNGIPVYEKEPLK